MARKRRIEATSGPEATIRDSVEDGSTVRGFMPRIVADEVIVDNVKEIDRDCHAVSRSPAFLPQDALAVDVREGFC